MTSPDPDGAGPYPLPSTAALRPEGHSVVLQLSVEPGAVDHLPVDDAERDPAPVDLENRPDIGGAVAGKALVRPSRSIEIAIGRYRTCGARGLSPCTRNAVIAQAPAHRASHGPVATASSATGASPVPPEEYNMRFSLRGRNLDDRQGPRAAAVSRRVTRLFSTPRRDPRGREHRPRASRRPSRSPPSRSRRAAHPARNHPRDRYRRAPAGRRA